MIECCGIYADPQVVVLQVPVIVRGWVDVDLHCSCRFASLVDVYLFVKA